MYPRHRRRGRVQHPLSKIPSPLQHLGYTQLRQVERGFLASTFAQMSYIYIYMSADEILKLEKYAKNAIQTLLLLACGFPSATLWPKPAKDRMSKAD
eukprot:2720613-Amphidinium_carterae.3